MAEIAALKRERAEHGLNQLELLHTQAKKQTEVLKHVLGQFVVGLLNENLAWICHHQAGSLELVINLAEKHLAFIQEDQPTTAPLEFYQHYP